MRASLVPAAAVIPAHVVYIKIVAVKKLVVDSRGKSFFIEVSEPSPVLVQDSYFEKIRALKAVIEYVSME